VLAVRKGVKMGEKLPKYTVLEVFAGDKNKYNSNELITEYVNCCKYATKEQMQRKLARELVNCKKCTDTIYIDIEVFDEFNVFDDLDKFLNFQDRLTKQE
jgi:hypothetical protein